MCCLAEKLDKNIKVSFTIMNYSTKHPKLLQFSFLLIFFFLLCFTINSSETNIFWRFPSLIAWFPLWINDVVEAVEIAIEVERENNIYSEKLTQVHLKYMEEFSTKLAQELLDKKFKKQMEELEEESETVLWN